jgi:hypothetical protein
MLFLQMFQAEKRFETNKVAPLQPRRCSRSKTSLCACALVHPDIYKRMHIAQHFSHTHIFITIKRSFNMNTEYQGFRVRKVNVSG